MENDIKKTGIFGNATRISVDTREKSDFIKMIKSRLSRIMGQHLESLNDGREYVIQSKFVEQEVPAPGRPDNVKFGWPKDLKIALNYSILLLDKDQAEINEYVHPSAITAPAPEINHYATEDGKMFERVGDPTWAWIRTA